MQCFLILQFTLILTLNKGLAMKNKKSARNANKKPSSPKIRPKPDANFNNVIRMKFLEQSAQCLEVFIESRPADYLYPSKYSIN